MITQADIHTMALALLESHAPNCTLYGLLALERKCCLIEEGETCMHVEIKEQCVHFTPCNCEACHIANRVTAEGAKTMEWISVKDRLPLKQEDVVNYETIDVIGCTRNNEVYNMEFAMGNTNGNQWHGFDDCADGYVTHWVPLPDPPR